jgi:hypothetical protein
MQHSKLESICLGEGVTAYAALQGLPRLARRTTRIEDESPHRGTVPTLLQHCSRTRSYLLTPCKHVPLEL